MRLSILISATHLFFFLAASTAAGAPYFIPPRASFVLAPDPVIAHYPIETANLEMVTQPFTIIKVTDDGEDDYRPCLHNGLVTWTRSYSISGWFELYQWRVTSAAPATSSNKLSDVVEGALIPTAVSAFDDSAVLSQGSTIFSWDGTTLTPWTDPGAAPSLYGGWTVFTQLDGNDYEIVLMDSNQVFHLSDDVVDDQEPTIFNGRVIWEGEDQEGHQQIYLWDGKGVTQLTSDPFNHLAPVLSEWGAAWTGEPQPGTREIYFWDGSSIIRLTSDQRDDGAPSISGSRVAWHHFDGNDYEILYWDGSKIIQITDNNTDDMYPSLYGGAVAWEGSDMDGDTEIFYAVVDQPAYSLVATGPTGITTFHSAFLSGRINTFGQETTWYFEWGTSQVYGNRTQTSSLSTEGVEMEVETTLSGLEADTTYHYRLVVEDAAGVHRGRDRTFSTPPLDPVQALPITKYVTNVGTTSARLCGEVNPKGSNTYFWFEYGTDTSYTHFTPQGLVGSSHETYRVCADIQDLLPGTRYLYRLAASSSAGISYANAKDFTTEPPMELPSEAGPPVIYAPVKYPVTNTNPVQAKPLGFSELSQGRFNLLVSLPQFDGPVDIYVALQAREAAPDRTYFLNQGGEFIPLRFTTEVWRPSTTGPVNEQLLPRDIAVSDIPPGAYTFFIAVTPVGNMETYYIWETTLVVTLPLH